MQHLKIFFLIFLLTNNIFCQFVSISKLDNNTVTKFVNHEVSKEKIVGLSLAIIKNGKTVYLNGFGFSDKEEKIKASENSLYRLASISKPITAILAMKLSQEGILNLDKDIRYYVPEYPQKEFGRITSKDLLSNQSGLLHYKGKSKCHDSYNNLALHKYVQNHINFYDPIEAINIFKDQKVCFEPGEHFLYSTWGFCLMGAVIERASNSTYEETLYNEIVEPLNLPYLQPEFQQYRPYPNEVKGYFIDKNKKINPTSKNTRDYKDVSYKLPAGGLICSVIDLSLLIEGIVNRKILNEKLLNEWGKQRIPRDGKNPFYGYGIKSGNRNGKKLLFHGGRQANTTTLIYFSPDNKNGVAIMSNTKGISLYGLARKIYDYIPEINVKKRNPLNIPNPKIFNRNNLTR